MENKPKCKMIGANGNVFNLMGLANRAMRKAGKIDESKVMITRITQSESYGKALKIMSEYLDIY